MKIFLKVILVAFLFSSCASKLGKVLKSKDNEYKLKMAEQYFAAKKYDKAQQIFDEIFPFFKGTDHYEDMFYKYTYCSYYIGDYVSAESLFKTYTENFPNSTRVEECDYMRAYSFYKQSPKVNLDQTNTSKAISLMQAFINTHTGSPRIKDATAIIDEGRQKLEKKEFLSAQLYYDLGYFKSAAVAYESLINDYADSDKSDEYKLNVIKAYYKYAELSVSQKQIERFGKVINECADFTDRFPDSKLKVEAEDYKTQSQNSINKLQYEQTKASTQR